MNDGDKANKVDRPAFGRAGEKEEGTRTGSRQHSAVQAEYVHNLGSRPLGAIHCQFRSCRRTEPTAGQRPVFHVDEAQELAVEHLGIAKNGDYDEDGEMRPVIADGNVRR